MPNKKFELTSETIVYFGRTLHRIKALVSFESVQAGNIGGFVEDERNLDENGNAWVSGNSRVSPIVITGAKYHITITDKHIRIGCKFHRIADWFGFSDQKIISMDGKCALKFWRTWKPILINICDGERRALTTE